jgi:hypothetical protein
MQSEPLPAEEAANTLLLLLAQNERAMGLLNSDITLCQQK